MKPRPDNEFAAFVGIDWADAKHDICLQVANSEKREFDVLIHRPDAIEQWACSLRQQFQGRRRATLGHQDRHAAHRGRCCHYAAPTPGSSPGCSTARYSSGH
jgi:hypothetical protein